jgi:hypothetical protein
VKQPGLPNITGTFSPSFDISTAWPNDRNTGAFGTTTTLSSNANRLGYVSGGTGVDTDIDASRSSSIYGNSDTVQPYSLTCRYIIKAYDGVTPTPAEADISEMLTELTGKADRRLSNLDTANLACHVVVDSYYDDTTGDWWREYSDGWVEQGVHNIGRDVVTNLLKPYADTSYSAVLYNGSNANTANVTPCLTSKTTTSFSALFDRTTGNAAYFAGMGAQS